MSTACTGDRCDVGKAAVSSFLRRETELTGTPLVPDIALYLAIAPREIWSAAEQAGLARPFWAFAWPGGQALARYLLDRPDLVAGRTVLDFGAGSGLVGLAARKAGASSVTASDIDGAAVEAIRMNAVSNGLEIVATADDLLDGTPAFDVVLIADVAYETPLARRVGAFAARAAARGSLVLFADRDTTFVPPHFQPRAHYDTVIVPALEDGFREAATVWQA